MDKEFILLLSRLDEMLPYQPIELRTKLDNVLAKAKKIVWWALSLSSAFLVLFAWCHTYVNPLSGPLKLLGIALGFITVLLGLFTLALEVIPVVKFFKFKKYAFNLLKESAASDYKYAERLHGFDLKIIEDVRCWLSIKSDRIENRVNLFKGAFALFFTLIGAPTVVQYLGRSQGLALFSGAPDLPSGNLVILLILAFFLSFLAGLIIGSVISRFLRYRYIYQIGILDLAKQLRTS